MIQELILDGRPIQVVHTWGKKGYQSPPTLRKKLFDLQAKLFKLSTGYQIPTPRAHSELMVVQKWKECHVPGYGNNPVYQLQKMGYSVRDIIRKLNLTPWQIRIAHGFYWLSLNGLLDEGMDQMWDHTDGTGGTLYNNANARVGVGNSTAAYNKTHTGLQGASTAFAAMDGGFPTSTTQRINCKGSFPTGQAEFAWEEYTIDNGSVANKNLNRALQSNGTKPSGQTWTLEIQITLS